MALSEFRIEWLETKQIGVQIVVAGNRLQIPDLLPEAFDTSWDIQLEDKHFPEGRGALAGKGAKRACVIAYHGGNSRLADIVLNCRTPLDAH